jgi:hypothetical protein
VPGTCGRLRRKGPTALWLRVDLALGCQSRMAEGGIVPPHSVLAPGTVLGLLPSRALSPAQVTGIVAVVTLMRYGEQKREETGGSLIRPGCSIEVA